MVCDVAILMIPVHFLLHKYNSTNASSIQKTIAEGEQGKR